MAVKRKYPEYYELHCNFCGKKFQKSSRSYLDRKRQGQEKFYCSKSCSVKSVNAFTRKANKQRIDAQTHKICKKCGRIKTIENYRKRTDYGGYQSTCNICIRNQDYLKRAKMYDCEIDHNLDLMKIIERDKNKCYLCNKIIENNLQFDHVIPLSRKGSHTYNNVRVVHKKCNERKRNKTLEEYVKYLKEL